MGGAKRVADAFFKHIRSRKPPSLFSKMMRSLDSGQYHVPKSFQVLARCEEDSRLLALPAAALQSKGWLW
jgi:hypothetical protein